MRRSLFMVALLALLPVAGWAQNGGFIRYHPPGGTGSGSGTGDADPAQFSSPGGDIVVGGIVGAVTLDVDGSTISHFASGVAAASGNCTLGDTYLETDANLFSVCTSTNTWRTAISLSDNVPVANLNSGTSASATTFWRGDGTWATPSGGSAFDPTTTIDFFDEMLQISVAASEQDTWAEVAFAAAAAAEAPACPATGFNVGCWQIDMPTTDNGGSAYRTAQVMNATSGNWVFQARFQANATAAIGVWMGLLWHTTAGSRQPLLASEGMWVRYDTDASDTNYTFQVCDAASAAGCQAAGDDTDNAVIASTVAATADAWHIARIEMDQTGVGGVPTVYMSIDGGASKTFCSSGCDDSNADMPAVTTTLYPFFACGGRDNAGTQNCYVDYVRFTGTR